MSNKRVRALYEARLATWAAARSPVLRVAYQNAPFTPQAGETYLQALLLPADTDSEDLEGAHRVYQGVFAVNVMAPINTGAGAAEGIGDELAALFTLNLRLTASGFTVQQVSPVTLAPALQDESRYTAPASFEYRADTT